MAWYMNMSMQHVSSTITKVNKQSATLSCSSATVCNILVAPLLSHLFRRLGIMSISVCGVPLLRGLMNFSRLRRYFMLSFASLAASVTCMSTAFQRRRRGNICDRSLDILLLDDLARDDRKCKTLLQSLVFT